jgi:preprotein translocase subunit YajC
MNMILMQAAGDYSSVIMLVLMFVILYFFMIRPQMKRQKAEKNFQSELKKGDKIVTTSGIHGKIAELTDKAAVIETGAGKIKFDRTAISNEFTAAAYPVEKK